MSGIVGAEKAAVEAALASFASSRGGSFRPAKRSTEQPNTLVLGSEQSRCSVLYPSEFMDWDEASRELSTSLKCPVFSFHIHDGDLWMFLLFDKGEQVAQFNPLPEYWDDEISEEERESWAGDADMIASVVPGVNADLIQPYFKHWNLDEENPGKAFPDDQFSYHEDWQMCDFMNKIGLKYPMDDKGEILGETFEFKVPTRR